MVIYRGTKSKITLNKHKKGKKLQQNVAKRQPKKCWAPRIVTFVTPFQPLGPQSETLSGAHI